MSGLSAAERVLEHRMKEAAQKGAIDEPPAEPPVSATPGNHDPLHPDLE